MGNLKEAQKNLAERRRRVEDGAYLLKLKLEENDDFSKAETELNSLRFEFARKKASNLEIGNLKEELSEAERKFNAVLAKYGKTMEDLNPPPDCPLCGDRYYVDGKPCACLLKEAKKIGRASENRPTDTEREFPERYLGASAEEEKQNLNAAELLRRWTNVFPNVQKTKIILTGKTGVGKSRLASVIVNCLNERDFTALFINAQRLNDLFLKVHLAPLSEKGAILAPVYDADLLVVDDLGAENFLNNVTAEQLYTLLSVRAERPLIVTTNLTADELRERYGERVFSRLFDRNHSLCMKILGIDLRLGIQHRN